MAFSVTTQEQAGMPRAQAEAQAHAQFGDLDQVAEACLLAQDECPNRQALRAVFTTCVLALGFAAFTLAVGLAYNILLQPIRLDTPDRLVRPGTGWNDTLTPTADLLAWREQSTTLERLTVFNARELTLTALQDTPSVEAMLIGANYFDIIGARPILGRLIRADETETQFTPVALITEALWETRYQRDLEVLGQTLEVDGHALRIVGVMPEAAQLSHKVDLWAPLWLLPEHPYALHYSIARLHEGATLDEANAELAHISATVSRPADMMIPSPLAPLRALYETPIRPTVMWLLKRGILLLVGLLSVIVWRTGLRALRVHRLAHLGAPEPLVSPIALALLAAMLSWVLIQAIEHPIQRAWLGREGTLFDLDADAALLLFLFGLAMGTGMMLQSIPRGLQAVAQLRTTAFASPKRPHGTA
ncbi:MAG: hypothetical protein RhofKO_35090 [Rhodothermales bacterium]